jgi:hypothetical protein
MSDPTAKSSASRSRWPRRWAVLAWASWVLSMALLLVQDSWDVLHPVGWPFVLLAVLTFAAGLLGLAWGLVWRRQRFAFLGALLALGPIFLWIALSLHAIGQTAGRAAPNTVPMRLAILTFASVAEAVAPWVYPQQVRTDRLVMFHTGVETPQRDAEEMEEHVARLEELIGKPRRTRIHWIRGKLLGRGRLAIRGLALGSDESPKDWKTADHPDGLSLDRHELAHAVLHQHYTRHTDPPTLLIEGWAEAHSGLSSAKRTEWALLSRKLWLERKGVSEDEAGSYIGELVEGENYRRIHGPVYSVGGAFADYLMRTVGVKAFLELYFACRPGRFAEAFRDTIGEELAEVENWFWADLRARKR